MYGDFILWFRYKTRNRIKIKSFIRDLKWKWYVFKDQNIDCVHDYRVMKADLSNGSLYACKHCGRRKTTKKNIY